MKRMFIMLVAVSFIAGCSCTGDKSKCGKAKACPKGQMVKACKGCPGKDGCKCGKCKDGKCRKDMKCKGGECKAPKADKNCCGTCKK